MSNIPENTSTQDADRAPGWAKGRTPENWNCIDCGFNTAPGFVTRIAMEEAFDAGAESIPMTITWDSEIYTVRPRVWQDAEMEPHGGCLCIGCLEKRLGRRLRPKDFKHDHVFNSPDFPASARLRQRRGQAMTTKGASNRRQSCAICWC